MVVGKGVKPNIELAEDSGIKFEEGVLVDNYMRTNIRNIYAAGDIAQSYDPILGEDSDQCPWPNAIEQGLIAAASISGEPNKNTRARWMNSVEFFGLLL